MAGIEAQIAADYLGMPLQIDGADNHNREFFQHCANGEFRLQCCNACGLCRYPPGTACPWCGASEYDWKPVPTSGTVYSYAEVHHPIQAAFAGQVPYSILIVELDFQRDLPNAGDAIRVTGNLADESGHLLFGDVVQQVGIGSRVQMVFCRLSSQMALPMWTLDHDDTAVWRYPTKSENGVSE